MASPWPRAGCVQVHDSDYVSVYDYVQVHVRVHVQVHVHVHVPIGDVIDRRAPNQAQSVVGASVVSASVAPASTDTGAPSSAAARASRRAGLARLRT